MDKMHKKGLTVEQYLSSVLATVCVVVVLLCIYALKVTLLQVRLGSLEISKKIFGECWLHFG